MSVPFTRRGIANGARQALPLAASSFPFTLIFGTLAQTAGLKLAEVALMSATVCAGSAQFVVIGLWSFPPVLSSILAATLLVNLRHILLGATLRGWFAGTPRPQLYGSAFFLFDETWALTHREADTGGHDRGFLLGCGLVFWFFWTTGSTLGYLVGDLIPDPTRWGLDFAATAVFLALLTGMWRGRHDLLPWLVAAGVAIAAARWLPGQWYIVLGGLTGSLVGMWRDAE